MKRNLRVSANPVVVLFEKGLRHLEELPVRDRVKRLYNVDGRPVHLRAPRGAPAPHERAVARVHVCRAEHRRAEHLSGAAGGARLEPLQWLKRSSIPPYCAQTFCAQPL